MTDEVDRTLYGSALAIHLAEEARQRLSSAEKARRNALAKEAQDSDLDMQKAMAIKLERAPRHNVFTLLKDYAELKTGVVEEKYEPPTLLHPNPLDLHNHARMLGAKQTYTKEEHEREVQKTLEMISSAQIRDQLDRNAMAKEEREKGYEVDRRTQQEQIPYRDRIWKLEEQVEKLLKEVAALNKLLFGG